MLKTSITCVLTTECAHVFAIELVSGFGRSLSRKEVMLCNQQIYLITPLNGNTCDRCGGPDIENEAVIKQITLNKNEVISYGEERTMTVGTASILLQSPSSV